MNKPAVNIHWPFILFAQSRWRGIEKSLLVLPFNKADTISQYVIQQALCSLEARKDHLSSRSSNSTSKKKQSKMLSQEKRV
jgi:hypothetical protein